MTEGWFCLTNRVAAANDASTAQQKRGFWLRTLHHWHWISSAVCLAGMLLFTVTGVTLNHASLIEGKPQIRKGEAQLPASLLTRLKGDKAEPLPAGVADWLSRETRQSVRNGTVEWSDEEVYVSMPRAGGDAWLSIDRATGAVEFENTSRGTVSYLNDLHKGRNTGGAWNWFIDVFAVGCIVFCITGLILLYFHARQRQLTWPLVGLGLLIPLLLALLFVH